MQAPLGIPLPPIHYHVAAGLKVVHYWAVKVNGAPLVPDGKEVDSVMWCAPDKAAALLTNPRTSCRCEHLREAHARGELDTWPLLVVRHAKAKPRSSWTKAEGDRPLAATGPRQAQAVGRLLQAWKPPRVVTSPWLRCVATVAPYAKASGAKVKLARGPDRAPAPAQPAKDGRRRRVALRQAACRWPSARTGRPCPRSSRNWASTCPAPLGSLLPAADPYLSPGEMIVCHVAAPRGTASWPWSSSSPSTTDPAGPG